MNPLLRKLDSVHLVGIGGIGMEGLARYLGSVGIAVQGSDASNSQTLKFLSEDGFKIWSFHDSSHIENVDLVVYSAAVNKDNIELVAAENSGVNYISRAEFIGELSRWHETISVAGTHGKTTSSAMLTKIFVQSGLSPSMLVGGTSSGRAIAKYDRDPWLILEADEYAKSFLCFHSDWAIITGVEAEHIDCYRSTNQLEKAFIEFSNRLPFYGEVFVAGDGLVSQEVISGIKRKIQFFGFHQTCNFRIENLSTTSYGSSFDFYHENQLLGTLELDVPGEHNVRNAAGVVALSHRVGISWNDIAIGLKSFKSVDRRFELSLLEDNVVFVDDYAHHPSEIASALSAARNMGRRVVAIFQPHLYSRTKVFLESFSTELMKADYVVVTEIYSARESFVPDISGSMIVDEMQRKGFHDVCFIKNLEDVTHYIRSIINSGDLVITMGAGDVWKIAQDFIDRVGETV